MLPLFLVPEEYYITNKTFKEEIMMENKLNTTNEEFRISQAG